MPFGLKNASATFQKVMDSIFRGCQNVVVYIDDILIGSPNEEEHLKDIKLVLKKLKENG